MAALPAADAVMSPTTARSSGGEAGSDHGASTVPVQIIVASAEPTRRPAAARLTISVGTSNRLLSEAPAGGDGLTTDFLVKVTCGAGWPGTNCFAISAASASRR